MVGASFAPCSELVLPVRIKEREGSEIWLNLRQKERQFADGGKRIRIEAAQPLEAVYV